MRWLANRRVRVAHAANAHEAGSGALGGSSVRSCSASSVQRREPSESTTRDSSEGEKEKERESLHLKISPYIWRGLAAAWRGERGIWSARYFFLCVSLFFSGEGLWAFACKDDGRGDRGEGETEAESRLSHAVTDTRRSSWRVYEPVRHLHTPGETLGRRYVCVNPNRECVTLTMWCFTTSQTICLQRKRL